MSPTRAGCLPGPRPGPQCAWQRCHSSCDGESRKRLGEAERGPEKDIHVRSRERHAAVRLLQVQRCIWPVTQLCDILSRVFFCRTKPGETRKEQPRLPQGCARCPPAGAAITLCSWAAVLPGVARAGRQDDASGRRHGTPDGHPTDGRGVPAARRGRKASETHLRDRRSTLRAPPFPGGHQGGASPSWVWGHRTQLGVGGRPGAMGRHGSA